MMTGKPEKLLSWNSVLTTVPVSQRTIQRRIAEQKFPRPRRIGRRSLFLESEIIAFIEGLKGQRRVTQ